MSGEFVPLDFPPWVQWGQRTGANIDRKGWPRGESGRALCGWCKTEVPPRRSSWCSDECARKYLRVWSWEAVRRYVIARDGERCARCGTTEPPMPTQKGWNGRYDPWDVDHILPVLDGGTDDPANLRVLCMPCHVAVGYEQRRARKPQADMFAAQPGE